MQATVVDVQAKLGVIQQVPEVYLLLPCDTGW